MSESTRSEKPRVHWWVKWAGIVLVTIVIIGSGLTIGLAGNVGHPSIQIDDVSNFARPIYGELRSSVTVGYSEDFVGWRINQTSPFISAQVTDGSDYLALAGSINNDPAPSSVSITKAATIDIATYPILEAQLNVTDGVSYGLRFFGQYPNGSRINVWYDGSSLDHRSGNGFEILRVNMIRQAVLATGNPVGTIRGLQIYVESRANNPVTFDLRLTKLAFSKGVLSPMVNSESYRAAYVDLGNSLGGNISWSLNRVQVGVTIAATSNTTFSLYLLDGYGLFTTLETPSSYRFSPLTPTYDLVFYPVPSTAPFSELLPRSNASFVLVALTGSFKNADLSYADLIYLPSSESAPDLAQSSVGLYFVYFVFFLFLLPVGMSLLIYQEFSRGKSNTRQAFVASLAIGLICRLALAPFAIHAFDMNVLLTSARGWFQYGTARVSAGPTLPITFYLYWIPYSFYALIQSLGFKDIFLPFHDVGIVETFFIKAFPMSMDVLIFLLLLRFSPSGKNLVWASFYFLNPLAIFGSSIYGHYDAATMALLMVGISWVSSQKIVRAGMALASAALLQLLGIVTLSLLMVKTAAAKQYKLSLALTGLGLLSFAYPPQRDLTYRLVLGVLGLGSGSQFTSASYTLLGSFGLLGEVPLTYPLLIAAALVLGFLAIDAIRKNVQAKKLLLYTCLSFVTLLLFLNLPNEWYWLLPIGIFYASATDNDNLGVFMLVFGVATCFLTISYTVTSAYYLLGSRNPVLLPAIEGVRNGTRIFAIMMTILAGLFLAYIKGVRGQPNETLIRSSLLVLGSFILVYFWISVFSI